MWAWGSRARRDGVLRTEAAILLREAGSTNDAELLAEALLAPLAADLYRHQRMELEVSAKRIRDTVLRVADGMLQTREEH